MRKLYILFFILLTKDLVCQKFDYNWVTGYDSYGTNPIWGGTQFDFTFNPVNIKSQPRHMNFGLVNSAMSNKFGDLEFYSNGCQIDSRFNLLMENGENINPGFVHNLKCADGEYTSGPQSMINIPAPEKDNLYYIFHQGIKYVEQPVFDVLSEKLYFTQIDMSLNNFHGKVLQKNIIIMEDSLNAGEISAIRHSNGIDWWIVVPKDRSNGYYSFLLTKNGIKDTVLTYIGDKTDPYGNGGGQAVFTPDGSKYIRFNSINKIRMFDFNRTTGVLSDFEKIDVDFSNYFANIGGCAVSPNSRFLYISAIEVLYQLDLKAVDIAASAVVIDEWDGTAQPWLPATFYLCQLAADCRIYINSPNSVDVMHVINKPNEKGLACDFVQNGIKLPTLNFVTIPNFPNYRQGPEGQDYQVCDSTVQVFTPFFEPKNLEVYPNPTNSSLFLKTTKINSPFKIYDVLGNQVMSGILKNETTELDISELEKGVYFVYLNERVRPIKLVVMRA